MNWELSFGLKMPRIDKVCFSRIGNVDVFLTFFLRVYAYNQFARMSSANFGEGF